MQFIGLKLSGFKSFVEPTELEIAPGLTGIVGPNGCGKSNLVEALRWVMGEASARRMRGGEMDDVIFAGTARRPARNIAEVSLSIDNEGLTAPLTLNDATELEVTRRIERGAGSDYLVNSRAVRAKDVSLLFQDNGTGAHSAALVSQGRIGALIAAKPTERRLLLEEAAGITGLHTRRHEAELKLKGAEANLQRVEDVFGTMDVQLNMLKKQARQAARYRNINTEVRRQEAMLLHLRWLALLAELGDATGAFQLTDAKVAELMQQVARFETARLEAAAMLPELRTSEATSAAVVQRLNHARAQIEAEAQRIAQAQANAQAKQSQAAADTVRERHLSEDAARALASIEAEMTNLAGATGVDEGRLERLAARVEATMLARQTAEAGIGELQGSVSTAEAEAASFDRQINDLTGRLTKAESRLTETQTQRARLEADKLSDLFVHTALREAEAAGENLAATEAAMAAAEAARTGADSAASAARTEMQQADANRASLNAESQAIARMLAAGMGDYPPVLAQVRAARGFEQALAAALGEDLALPLDSQAHAYWQELANYEVAPNWPAGVTSLAGHIQAPIQLARRLAFIGVIEEEADGASLALQLQPGQALVSRAGAVWRWDGVVVKAGAPTTAALRLQQRNRLAELTIELARADSLLEAARATHAARATAMNEAAAAVRNAREGHEAALGNLTRARRAASEAEASLTTTNARLASLTEVEERLGGEIVILRDDRTQAESRRAKVPDVSAARAALANLRTLLATAQSEAADAEAARRQWVRETEARQLRHDSLLADQVRWRERATGATTRLAELVQRSAEASAELAQLAARPNEIAAQRNRLMDELADAEAARRHASDALAQAETILAEAERSLKHTEHALSDTRENRARLQAEVGNLQQNQQALIERIAEKCECRPEVLPQLADIEASQPLPEPEGVEVRLIKLVRERDALGPVNLRAEQEMQEQQAQMDTMVKERDELVEAINKLRGAIGGINREARARLLGAFDQVNASFQELFTRLFGGGSAALKLTEADDPLEAGLEVVAQPPGKKLQNLTLLSGGEQALTSAALIFAVFLANPSPICVLDEVDAPLDEANINRFCNLLDHMTAISRTRFLVITHQRLTMSRMHRLYGVTMMEKGVSQLVSVDLNVAAELSDAA